MRAKRRKSRMTGASTNVFAVAMDPSVALAAEQNSQNDQPLNKALNLFEAWVSSGLEKKHSFSAFRFRFKEQRVQEQFDAAQRVDIANALRFNLLAYICIYIVAVIVPLAAGITTIMVLLPVLPHIVLLAFVSVPRLQRFIPSVRILVALAVLILALIANISDAVIYAQFQGELVVRRAEIGVSVNLMVLYVVLLFEPWQALIVHIVFSIVLVSMLSGLAPAQAGNLFAYVFMASLFMNMLMYGVSYFSAWYKRFLFSSALSVYNTRQQLAKQQRKLEAALSNILPDGVFQRLRRSQLNGDPQSLIYDPFGVCSVVQLDIVGFTTLSSTKKPAELVKFLNSLFFKLDDLVVKRLRLEKIKTIGDAYICATGVPEPVPDNALVAVCAALLILDAVEELKQEVPEDFDIRVGVGTGSGVAGVIGHSKLFYDLWGEAVDIAAHMEESGVPGRLQICPRTAKQLRMQEQFYFRPEVMADANEEDDTFFELTPVYAEGHVPEDEEEEQERERRGNEIVLRKGVSGYLVHVQEIAKLSMYLGGAAVEEYVDEYRDMEIDNETRLLQEGERAGVTWDDTLAVTFDDLRAKSEEEEDEGMEDEEDEEKGDTSPKEQQADGTVEEQHAQQQGDQPSDNSAAMDRPDEVRATYDLSGLASSSNGTPLASPGMTPKHLQALQEQEEREMQERQQQLETEALEETGTAQQLNILPTLARKKSAMDALNDAQKLELDSSSTDMDEVVEETMHIMGELSLESWRKVHLAGSVVSDDETVSRGGGSSVRMVDVDRVLVADAGQDYLFATVQQHPLVVDANSVSQAFQKVVEKTRRREFQQDHVYGAEWMDVPRPVYMRYLPEPKTRLPSIVSMFRMRMQTQSLMPYIRAKFLMMMLLLLYFVLLDSVTSLSIGVRPGYEWVLTVFLLFTLLGHLLLLRLTFIKTKWFVTHYPLISVVYMLCSGIIMVLYTTSYLYVRFVPLACWVVFVSGFEFTRSRVTLAISLVCLVLGGVLPGVGFVQLYAVWSGFLIVACAGVLSQLAFVRVLEDGFVLLTMSQIEHDQSYKFAVQTEKLLSNIFPKEIAVRFAREEGFFNEENDSDDDDDEVLDEDDELLLDTPTPADKLDKKRLDEAMEDMAASDTDVIVELDDGEEGDDSVVVADRRVASLAKSHDMFHSESLLSVDEEAKREMAAAESPRHKSLPASASFIDDDESDMPEAEASNGLVMLSQMKLFDMLIGPVGGSSKADKKRTKQLDRSYGMLAREHKASVLFLKLKLPREVEWERQLEEVRREKETRATARRTSMLSLPASNGSAEDGASVPDSESTDSYGRANPMYFEEAVESVKQLHEIYSKLDMLCEEHKVEKMKSNGNYYMVAAGLPGRDRHHALHLVRMALKAIEMLLEDCQGIQVYAGINSGRVVASLVGKTKWQYDIFGDTVNVSSRMMSTAGRPNVLHVSKSTYQHVMRSVSELGEAAYDDEDGFRDFVFQRREKTYVKGKGLMTTYFVHTKEFVSEESQRHSYVKLEDPKSGSLGRNKGRRTLSALNERVASDAKVSLDKDLFTGEEASTMVRRTTFTPPAAQKNSGGRRPTLRSSLTSAPNLEAVEEKDDGEEEDVVVVVVAEEEAEESAREEEEEKEEEPPAPPAQETVDVEEDEEGDENAKEDPAPPAQEAAEGKARDGEEKQAL